jgi:hypothetical protein
MSSKTFTALFISVRHKVWKKKNRNRKKKKVTRYGPLLRMMPRRMLPHQRWGKKKVTRRKRINSEQKESVGE